MIEALLPFKTVLSVEQAMKVALFFVQPAGRTRETVMYSLYGRFNFCGFMFIGESDVRSFYTLKGGVFKERVLSQKSDRAWDDGEIEILMLSVDTEETQKLLATCQACVQVAKPFNLRDLVLMYVPFREVEELPVDQAPTLNNTQAVIVTLRACLKPDHILCVALEGLHSRQTLMESLYDRLLPVTVPVTWSNVMNLVRWSVVERSQDPALTH